MAFEFSADSPENAVKQGDSNKSSANAEKQRIIRTDFGFRNGLLSLNGDKKEDCLLAKKQFIKSYKNNKLQTLTHYFK